MFAGTLRRDGLVWIAALTMTSMLIGAAQFWKDLGDHKGYDFYEYWGCGKAQREAGYRLGSPYLAADRYQAELRKIASASNDTNLGAVLNSRPKPDMIGTPLLYYLFSNLPDNYTTALNVYRAIQVFAFLLAVFLLIHSGTRAWLPALVFAPLLAAVFDPLYSDLAVCNLDSIQLLCLVTIAYILESYQRQPRRVPALLAAALCSGLVLLTLTKPNIAGAALLLGLSLAIASSARARIYAAVAALINALLLLALPCLLFGSWSLWQDWWSRPFLKLGLAEPLKTRQNYSFTSLLFRHLDISAAVCQGTVGAFLVCTLAAALLVPGSGLKFGRSHFRTSIVSILKRPYACLALSMLVLIMPLAVEWSHYQILLLAPVLWLLSNQNAPLPARLSALLSLLLLADLARRLYLLAGGIPWIWVETMHGLAWLPAWIGLCLTLRQLSSAASDTRATALEPSGLVSAGSP